MLSEDEKQIVFDYYYQITMRSGSAEIAIFKLMEQPILAFDPIFNEIDNIKRSGVKLYFVYGDRDWIDTDMANVRISSQLKEKGEKVFILEDCDHHLYFDNPEELLDTLDECMAD